MNNTQGLLLKIRNGDVIPRGEKIKLALMLSLPSMLAQMVSVIMEYIDASMVGSLGGNASASIGLVASTTWLFGGVVYASVSGFTILASQSIGARRFKRARRIMTEGFISVTVFSLLICAVGLAISGSLPLWLGGSDSVRSDASAYFTVFSLLVPIMAVGRFAGGLLHSAGRMKLTGIIYSIACLLDVVFNMFFIFETRNISLFGLSLTLPGAGLGVMGAAIGTLAAEAVTALILLFFLLFKTPFFKKNYTEGETEELEGNRFFSFSDIKKSVKLSFPIALERVAVCGAMITITAIIAPLGNIALAANSLAVTAESFCYGPGYGVEEASTSLIGQSIGAKRKDLAFSFGKITLLLGMIIMGVFGAFMFLFSYPMMSVMTPVEEIRKLGSEVLRIEAFAEPMFAASMVITGILRGAGDTAAAALLNLLSLWGVRITLSLLLVGPLGLYGIWIAMAAELAFRGILFIIRFYRKKWLEKA